MPDRKPFPPGSRVYVLRQWRHRRHKLALATVAQPADTLLVPEIFQDSRLAQFRALRTWFPGRRCAVFHDAIALRLPEFTAAERKRNFADYVRTLAQFDKVICVSREAETDLREYWHAYGCAPAATVVLGWPTDFGQPRTAPQPNFQAKRILCVATLERRKNHLKLLEAAEQLWSAGMSFELILVGRTTGDWGDTVLAQVKQLKKRGRPLRWLRHVSDHTLHTAYRQCSFTVYPSLREGFGLPILESLWHGRPCICGADGAIGESARAGGCLTADPANSATLAAAIRELLSSEATYRRLVDEARARSFCSWDDYVDELLGEINTP